MLLVTFLGTTVIGSFLLYGYTLTKRAGNAWKVSDEAALFTIFIFMAFFMLWYLYRVGTVLLQPLGTRLYYHKSKEEIESDLQFMDAPGPLGQIPLSKRLPVPDFLRVGREFIFIKGPSAALIPVKDVLWIYCCQTPKKTVVKKKDGEQPLIYQVHLMTVRGSHYYVNFDTWNDMAAFMRPLEQTYPDLCHEFDSNRYLRWWFHFDDFREEMNRLRELSAARRDHLQPVLERTLENAFRSYPKVRADRLYRPGEPDSLPYVLVVTEMESAGPNCRRIRGYASGKIRKGELLVVYDNTREAGTCTVEEVLEDPKYRGCLIVRDLDAEIRTPDAVVLTTQSEQDNILSMNPAVFALIATAGQWPNEGPTLSYLSFAVQNTGFWAPIYRAIEVRTDEQQEDSAADRRFTLMSVARHSEESEEYNAEDPQPMMALLTDLRDSGLPNRDGTFDIRFTRMEFPEILSYVRSSFYGLAIDPFGPATANLPNSFLHTVTTSSGAKRLAERQAFAISLLHAGGTEWHLSSEEAGEDIPTYAEDIPTYSEGR